MAEGAAGERCRWVEDWLSRSVEETERAGAVLAPALQPGDVIAVSGPLGAGKTRLAAGIARGLGCRATVRSPTFTLVNEYHGRLTLFHVDLYRLEGDELVTLGLEEYRELGALVVEWGERLPPSVRSDALIVEIDLRAESERLLTARSGRRGRGAELQRAWKAARDAAVNPPG